jgi:large conductance mechanosensitive channel
MLTKEILDQELAKAQQLFDEELIKIKNQSQQTLEEYKQFAFRGNIISMATAFILGAAFDNLVKSISSNIIMPFVNFIILQAGTNWRDVKWTPINGLTFEPGKAFGSLFDFLLISIVLFFMMRWMGNLNLHKENNNDIRRR